MGIISKKKLTHLENELRKIVVSPKLKKQIEKDREEVKNILSGKDERLLVIVGPCSAWPHDAVVEYARRIKDLNEEVSDKLKIIMRVYTQKPRTIKGWTGVINQPDPFLPANIEKGAKYVRLLMLEILSLGLSVADELLFTHKSKWVEDLLSWVAIGARSTEDHEHRVFASATDCPVGMKNPTSGSIRIGVNSVVAAQNSHSFYFDGYHITTSGNPFAHLVLRGGDTGPNYQARYISQAKQLFEENNVAHPAIIIDASHDNTLVQGVKMFKKQIDVVQNVLLHREKEKEMHIVKGFIIESFLKEGNQNIQELSEKKVDMQGLSITDACLGWEDTEQLIREIYKKHKKD